MDDRLLVFRIILCDVFLLQLHVLPDSCQSQVDRLGQIPQHVHRYAFSLSFYNTATYGLLRGSLGYLWWASGWRCAQHEGARAFHIFALSSIFPASPRVATALVWLWMFNPRGGIKSTTCFPSSAFGDRMDGQPNVGQAGLDPDEPLGSRRAVVIYLAALQTYAPSWWRLPSWMAQTVPRQIMFCHGCPYQPGNPV